jgi:hypothetical protein
MLFYNNCKPDNFLLLQQLFLEAIKKTKVTEIAFCLRDFLKHQFAITVALTNAPEA